MRKSRIKKRLLTFVLCVALLCSVFAINTFAWTSSPIGAEYYVYLESPDFPDECAAVAWYSPNDNASPEKLNFALDFSIVNSIEEVQYLSVLYDSTSLLTNGGALTDYNAQVREPLMDLYKNNNLYVQGFVDGMSGVSDIPADTIQNAINTGETIGFDKGYLEGFSKGESRGYTKGVGESEIGKNFLLTVFSVPTYVLSTIFNFEILGINVYLLITFLLTICIVGVVLKKLL